MAITSILEAEWEISRLRRPTRRGRLIRRSYSFTKLTSDSSVTIATSIGTTPGNGKILTTQATSNSSVTGLQYGVSFDVATGIVTLVSGIGTTGPTIGWLDLVLSITG